MRPFLHIIISNLVRTWPQKPQWINIAASVVTLYHLTVTKCKMNVGFFLFPNFPKMDVQAGLDVSWNDTLVAKVHAQLIYFELLFHLKLCLLSLELVGGAAPYEPPS